METRFEEKFSRVWLTRKCSHFFSSLSQLITSVCVDAKNNVPVNNFQSCWDNFLSSRAEPKQQIVTLAPTLAPVEFRQLNTIFEHTIIDNISLSIGFNICVGCLKEPSHWDGSFEYPQHMFSLRNKKKQFLLNPFLPYIMHAIRQVKIRLFWCYYGVKYNFIQNHNHCRDLHQIFSCLFETFGTMSEIMFSSDSMSNFFSTAENTWMSTFVYNIIVLEWLGNNCSKMWEWQEFPPLPLLIPININCHPYTSHFRLPK